jgi:predicted Rossmann fold flavoprotein
LVIGGGAAGLTAAYTAAENGADVLLLERNERPARKILLTGKGRCNVTNACSDLREIIANIPGNGQFLYSALSRYMPQDAISFFEENGVPLKTERGRRVFPVSDKSTDITDALVRACRRTGVRVEHGRAAQLIIKDGQCLGAITEEGGEYRAAAVIVATGGLSYPQTGSTGDGYALAKQAGHTVTALRPSLVALDCHEGFVSSLQGLSLRNVTLRAIDTQTNRVVFEELGEMLFTHFGVSGPLALSASAHMRDMGSAPSRYRLQIDLKPARSAEQLEERIQREISGQRLGDSFCPQEDAPNQTPSHGGRKNFINVLNSILPKSLVPVIMRLAGFPLDLRASQLTREQRRTLAELLKSVPLTVTGFRPIAEAVVTSGGVDVREIDPKTLASRLVGGLYFAGEVLDVDAYTGGYNLQIAFATGRAAGFVNGKFIV